MATTANNISIQVILRMVGSLESIEADERINIHYAPMQSISHANSCTLPVSTESSRV
jgi:hypothetical protein